MADSDDAFTHAPGMKRLVKHIAALCREHLVETHFTPLEQKILLWLDLDLYDVDAFCGGLTDAKDFLSKLKIKLPALHSVVLHGESKVLFDKLLFLMQYRDDEEQLSDTAINRHVQRLQSTPMLQKSPQLKQQFIKYARKKRYATTIRNQPHITLPGALPPTVIVAARTHGSFSCNPNTTSENLQTYTIPKGKTLAIIVLAQVGQSNLVISRTTQALIDKISTTVNKSTSTNAILNPVDFIAEYQPLMDQMNEKILKQYTEDNAIIKLNPRLDKAALDSYVKTWEPSRVLYFHGNEPCLNKTFLAEEPLTEIIKFQYTGWDVNLMPPLGICNTRKFYLAQMCDYLFHGENRTNIVLIDMSCGVFTDLPPSLQSSVIKRTTDRRLYG